MDFGKIRDKIAFKLINRKKSRYPLDEIPHTDFLDLAYVYFVILNMDGKGIDTVMVRNEYLDRWGISEEELHDIAESNFRRLFSMEIYGVRERDSIIMVTTKYKMFGAVFMGDKQFIGSLADLFRDDICIVPSSIHEIILCPADGIEREQMDSIICDVNEKAVEEDEYLSDHMYLFSREEKRVVF